MRFQLVEIVDTITAITGSIAEAAYGISEDMKEMALSYWMSR